MKERFEGPGRPHLIECLKRQEFVAGDTSIAEAIAGSAEPLEFQKGDKIIVQDGEDNDIYFLIAGTASIVIKGLDYRVRKPGEPVGEMAAIEPTQRRSADVVARETVVAVKLPNAAFMELGKTFPQIWLPMARVLSRKLFERNDLIQPPNEYPKLFIISSGEALGIAREVQAQLERDVFSTVWPDGVFFAGGYPLEALEKAVAESDFAIAIAQS